MRHSAEESKYSHDEHCFETTVFPHHCGTTAAKVQSPKHTASLAASLAAGQPGQGTRAGNEGVEGWGKSEPVQREVRMREREGGMG